MNFSNILNLAVKNIFLKKLAYLKVFVSLFLVFSLTFIVVFYSYSLSSAYSNYEYYHINLARYIVRECNSQSKEIELRKLNQVRSITITSDVELSYKSELIFDIGSKEYVLKQGMGGYVSGSVVNLRSDYSIPENISIAFSALTNEPTILYGTDIKQLDDIILSEQILNWLNIGERSELVGKKLTIKNGDFIKTGIISGILNKKLYEMSLFSSVFLCFQDEVFSDSYIDISLKSFSDTSEFFKKINEIFSDNVDHYFCGNSELEKMQLIEGQEILCKDFFSVICLIIILIICLYVASNQFYLLQKNSIFYGVLKASGTNNINIFVVHLFELLFIGIIALILALATSIGMFLAIQGVYISVFYIELTFSLGIAICCFIALLFLALILSFVITLFIYLKLLKKPTIYLLKN